MGIVLFAKKLEFNRKVAGVVEKLTAGKPEAQLGAKALAQAFEIPNTVGKEVDKEVRKRNAAISDNGKQIVKNTKTVESLRRENINLASNTEYQKKRNQAALTEKDKWAW